MSEKPLKWLVSENEADILRENASREGVLYIALGLLIQLRESGDMSMENLEGIHNRAVEGLPPGGPDYEGYKDMHNEAFYLLKQKSDDLKIG